MAMLVHIIPPPFDRYGSQHGVLLCGKRAKHRSCVPLLPGHTNGVTCPRCRELAAEACPAPSRTGEGE